MKTVLMGLNTEPSFTVADQAIQKWKLQGNDEMVEYWEKAKEESLALRDLITQGIDEYGECELSWSCTGRTRHEMHATQWRDAMPEYEFEIGYNYHCVVRKRKEK